MKRKILLNVLIVAILVVAVGCAGTIKTSYITLTTTKNLYVLAKQVCNDLYENGKITEDQRIEINKVATIYREAQNAASDALEVYAVSSTVKNKEQLKAAIALAGEKWADVAKLLNAIQPGAVPNTYAEVKP